jgi:hypothetical protein
MMLLVPRRRRSPTHDITASVNTQKVATLTSNTFILVNISEYLPQTFNARL